MKLDVNNSAYDEGRSGRLSYPSNGDTAAFRRGQDVSWQPSRSSGSTLDGEQAEALIWLVCLLLKAGAWLVLFALALAVQIVMLTAQGVMLLGQQLRRLPNERLRHFVGRWITPAASALEYYRSFAAGFSIAILTSIF